MEYEVHPAADKLPMLTGDRYKELRDSISANGQREPITLFEGKILDGRNRYKACRELGVEPKTKHFDGNPWLYVSDINTQRRDLEKMQRAIIQEFLLEGSADWEVEQNQLKKEANRKRAAAAKEQPRLEGGEFAPVVAQNEQPPVNPKQAKTRDAKAKKIGVSPATVGRAETFKRHHPDIAEKVAKGEVKYAEAQRQMKREEVQKKTRELPKDKYRVIYADPPWKYGDGRTGDKMTATGALHHYPTMALSELKALDVSSLACDDAVLFLWATCPLLEDALELAKAWGFKYKAQFIWDKVKHNMGHYNSVRHEILLICTRGSGTPDKVNLFDSVQSIERTEHSKKPEEFRDMIDALYEGPRIELFARGSVKRPWATWGNESNAD